MAKYKVQNKIKGKWVDAKRNVNISKDSADAMNVSSEEIGIKYVKVTKK